MSAERFSFTDAVLFWHDWAQTLAVGLLGLVFAYAMVQYAAAGSVGAAARRLTGGSLRAALLIGLTLVGTVPAAALGLMLAERSAHLRHDRMSVRLEEAAVSMAHAVDHFMDKHLAGVNGAAQAVTRGGRYDRASLADWLLLYHDIYPDFLTMLSADADGNIVAATSNMTGFLTPIAELQGHNVSDRAYFRQPMADGRPFISEVFQGRDLGRDPIVAVSAVVIDALGRRAGIVEGSLNLRAFSRIDEQRPRLDGSVMVLVDQDNRLIYATGDAGMTELESVASDPLITSAADADTGTYEFASGVDDHTHQFLGARAPTGNGWTVYLRVPLDQIGRQMVRDYLVSAILIFIACILSMLLAGAIVRRVSRSVGDMNLAVARFRFDGTEEPIATPENTPDEFRPIFRQMRRRSKQLRAAHDRLKNSIEAGETLRRELTQAIALKEVEIAEHTAELERTNERLSGLSKEDPLTGIPNRREFDAFATRVWRQGAREKTPAAVVLLDVDYFKIYNDRSGHQAGDECLREVAQTLRDCASRPLDLVARYGGEEFVAILGGTSVADALVVAERMRRAIFDLQIPHPGSSFGVVTISAGTASVVPSPEADLKSAIKSADEALYYAKAAGRNCVVFSEHGEYVTYDARAEDWGTTTVLSILASGHLKAKA
ncbi:MAG: diguanylate cyclase [Gammaproteobacteria bacterium]